MPGFTSIATARGSDQVVEQIRAAIQDGRLTVGGRMAPERELAVQFGVSRSVIREAIKTLNGMGLVESRQGAGIFVTANPAPIISRALTLTLKPEVEMVNQLFDIRVALETLAIRTVVRDASDEDLARLEALVPAEDDGDLVSVEQASNDDLAFHLAVSDISGNRYLHTMVQAVQAVFAEAFPITEHQREGIRRSRRAHREIARAMSARDADRAIALFLEHVGGTLEGVRRRSSGGTPPP